MMYKLRSALVLATLFAVTSCSRKPESTLAFSRCRSDGGAPGCRGVLPGFFANPSDTALDAAVSAVPWDHTVVTRRQTDCPARPCPARQIARSRHTREDVDFGALPSGNDALLLATISWVPQEARDIRYKGGGAANGDGAAFLLVSKADFPNLGTAVPAPPNAAAPIAHWYLVRKTANAIAWIAHGELRECQTPHDASYTPGFHGCPDTADVLRRTSMSVPLTSGEPPGSRQAHSSLINFAGSIFSGARIALSLTRLVNEALTATFYREDSTLDSYWFPCNAGCCTA